jgi:hypothetical protein
MQTQNSKSLLKAKMSLMLEGFTDALRAAIHMYSLVLFDCVCYTNNFYLELC